MIQQSPIIVKIVEAPSDPTGIADALVGALGLTGLITMLAVICGGVLAWVLTWLRSRRSVE